MPANPDSPEHEHPFPGDEDVLENDQAFLPPEPGIAHIDLAVFHLSRIGGLAPQDIRIPVVSLGTAKDTA